MLINDIKEYIELGKGEYLKIENFPEQPWKDDDRIFSRTNDNEEEYVRNALGLDGFSAKHCRFTTIIDCFDDYYPNLPYQFRDLKRRRWNGIRCLEDKNCSIIHEDFFIIVNLKKEFRELVECYGRVIERERRSQKGLGQLFRCNKLLINNGYEPVDFKVERGDIKRMIALDETTMSEIRENKDRRVFKRDGVECRMIGERMINLETGKEMQWELGYKI